MKFVIYLQYLNNIGQKMLNQKLWKRIVNFMILPYFVLLDIPDTQ